MPTTRVVVIALAVCCLLFLTVLPVSWLFLASISAGLPESVRNLTADNFLSTFKEKTFVPNLLNSLIYAAGAMALSIALATTLAVILTKTDTPLRGLLHTFILTPLFTPGVIYAVAWTLLAAPRIGLLNSVAVSVLGVNESFLNVNSYVGLIWVGGLVGTPLSFLLISASLRNIDSSLEEAAYASGANKIGTLLKVTLPLIRPALLAAGILQFLFQIGNFEIPAMIGLPAGIRVLTTSIFQYMTAAVPDYGKGTATSVVLFAMTAGLVFLYRSLTSKQGRFVSVTGKPSATRILSLGRWKYATLLFTILFVAVACALPFFVLIIASLSVSWGQLLSDPARMFSSLSFINYQSSLNLAPVRLAFMDSAVISIVGATALIAFAALLSYIITRSRFRGRDGAELLAFLPLAFPGPVIAIGLLWTYTFMPIYLVGTLAILVLASMTRFLPYAFQSTSTAYLQIHSELEESARTSGAGWLTTFRKISLPLMKNGILSGWLFLAVIFFRELDASIILYRPDTIVLSVIVYSNFIDNVWGQLCVVGVIMTLISYTLGLIIIRLTEPERLLVS